MKRPDPKEPEVVNYARLSLYIPEELSKWVRDQAYAARLPVSQFVVRMLRRAKSRPQATHSPD